MSKMEDEARAFVAKHVVECASELLAWQKTGLLVQGGRLRELGDLLKSSHGHDYLQIAELMVNKEALRVVASAKR